MKDKLFSELLKQKRFELKLSQLKMAKALGISKNMYQLYESGKYDNTTSVRREEYLFKLEKLKPHHKDQLNTSNPDSEQPTHHITDNIVSEDSTEELVRSFETLLKHKNNRIKALELENDILQKKINSLTATKKVSNEKMQ